MLGVSTKRKSETPIQHVTDTAFWVAAHRAQESARPDALFHDPLAARLVAGRGLDIAARMPSGDTVSWAVVMRTLIIDDYVRAAVAGGCDTILNLGAGLDTRPYRMDLPATLLWIEVDFPDTIAFKETTLAGEKPRCVLQRHGVDLADAQKRRAFLAQVSGQKVLVLTEGVLPYLSNEEAGALAVDLHARPTFAFWIVEHFSAVLMKLTRHLPHRRKLKNAPFKFAPADWHAFFAERGWAVKEMRSLGEEGKRTGRAPRRSWWLRLMTRLMSKAKRKTLRAAYAYALLERSD